MIRDRDFSTTARRAGIFTMMTTSAITLLLGTFLGLRFKIFILAPAIILGGTTLLGIGVAHGSSFWSVLLAMVVAITALQIGYVVGTVIRSNTNSIKPLEPINAGWQ